MSDTAAPIHLHAAAQRLGVTTRALRQAIRAGKLPAPPLLSATATVPAEWVANVQAQLETTPDALTHLRRPKVPEFARFRGTSFWTKFRVRARAYRRFQAEA